MIFSTVPGPSSGRLGPFQADVFQDIRPEEKRSELQQRLPSQCVRTRPRISAP